VFGDIENVFETAAMFACGFEVILKRGQCVGELIHLRTARHALIDAQFVADKATHAFGDLRRTRRRKHAHRAGHFVHQARHAVELIVLPARFHKRDDAVLDTARVRHRFIHQRRENVARLAARQHGVECSSSGSSVPRLSM
jgi:hypothetical protein